MNIESFNQNLFDYLDRSPTPFHAVAQASKLLSQAGFVELNEAESWSLKEGQAYFLTRNQSCLLAFVYASKDWEEAGCRLFGAHSDSPCLKVKPNPELLVKNYLKLGVEVYGGVLLNPWFDRDLSLAGRVVLETESGDRKSLLINFEEAIAFIPSLAIHLDREVNQKRSINSQTDIVPVLMQTDEKASKTVLSDMLNTQVKKQYPDMKVKKISDFELAFYDVQKAAYVGLNKDFIVSARLDNLLSCFVGVQALIEAFKQNKQNAVLVLNDHEEVGSQTAQGAQGTLLRSVLDRVCGNAEAQARCMAKSLLISSDNAHGVHPNFTDRHDGNHGPLLNKGLVIKMNANQRYATNSLSSARIKEIAEKLEEPIQSFVVRTDMACGSTIGPITAAELGVQTVDVGVPTFAMHSIRESAGAKDAYSLYRIAKYFFEDKKILI